MWKKPVRFLVVLVLLESWRAIESIVLQRRSVEEDVAALQELSQLILTSGRVVGGWNDPTLDPCGVVDCGNMNDDPPDGDFPRCNYEGISCRSWRVVAIDLACNEGCNAPLKGGVPPGLQLLQGLRFLDLSRNKLIGNLPAWRHEKLEVINLSYNSLGGQLPFVWGNTMRNLRVINLASNHLSGPLPNTWGSLSRLVTLDLSRNRLTGYLPAFWTGMTSLQVLDLRDNCGLCGGTPTFSNRTRTWYTGTNLDNACSAFNCNAPFFTNVMIAVAVIFGGLTLCMIQRHLCQRIHTRRRMRMESRERAAAIPDIDITVSDEVHVHPGNTEGQLRQGPSSLKAPPPAPTVVLMPDGEQIQFARVVTGDLPMEPSFHDRAAKNVDVHDVETGTSQTACREGPATVSREGASGSARETGGSLYGRLMGRLRRRNQLALEAGGLYHMWMGMFPSAAVRSDGDRTHEVEAGGARYPSTPSIRLAEEPATRAPSPDTLVGTPMRTIAVVPAPERRTRRSRRTR